VHALLCERNSSCYRAAIVDPKSETRLTAECPEIRDVVSRRGRRLCGAGRADHDGSGYEQADRASV